MSRPFLFAVFVCAAVLGGCAPVPYERVAYVEVGPPPPPRYEVITVSPGAHYVWHQGYWAHRGRGGWVWMGGHWRR
jgi:hypothetical protein